MHRALPVSEHTERPTVVCAWCSALLHRGADYLSHGICTSCCQELMDQIADAAPAAMAERSALVAAHA